MNFANESACLITFGMKGSSYICSQITGVENAVPLHVDIPRKGGRGSDLRFEAVLQDYLQFPYEYFLLVLPFGGVTLVNFVLQTTPEEIPLSIILSLKTSDKD
jgi:hypothetical protein